MAGKTIFEWAKLFQDEILAGTSQSNIIQMLENYKKEQLTILALNELKKRDETIGVLINYIRSFPLAIDSKSDKYFKELENYLNQKFHHIKKLN